MADALAADPVAEVVLVLSDREAAALQLATARDIPTHRLKEYRDPSEWLNVLAEARVDLLVLAGYLKLVPPDVIREFSGRIINIHPALLPKFGGPGMYGRRVHESVLAAAERISGATVHLVDEQYDRGAILAQGVVPVLDHDTPELLAARVLDVEHALLPRVVIAAAKAGRPTMMLNDQHD